MLIFVEHWVRSQESVFRRQYSGDYFYLSFPRNAHAVTPLHPTPYTPHPTPHTLHPTPHTP
ncbi:MAG: hypothetical protein GPJ13_21830, partial [Microcystis aeruginosa W11-06]|nr:hypothetical protein [Microcystis aeruginosa W11-06]